MLLYAAKQLDSLETFHFISSKRRRQKRRIMLVDDYFWRRISFHLTDIWHLAQQLDRLYKI